MTRSLAVCAVAAAVATLTAGLVQSETGRGRSARISAPTATVPAARLLQHDARVQPRARNAVAWRGGRLTTSTGEQVTVFVSERYPPEQQQPEKWGELLSRTPHGAELALVTVYIAPLDEMQEVCGGKALGCYGRNTLVSLGDPHGAVTPEQIVLHEYGHHIAGNRMNPPWLAIDSGPKAWATLQRVCPRTVEGSLFPGDEGDHYASNPGEGWAEAYRVYAEQRLGLAPGPWEIVDPSFQPDAAALVAIDRDVVAPWAGPTTTVRTKQMTAKGPRIWNLPVDAALDGELSMSVTFPKGANHEVLLLGPDGAVVAKGARYGARSQRLAATICGQRPLTLRVTRRGSVGRVSVTISAA